MSRSTTRVFIVGGGFAGLAAAKALAGAPVDVDRRRPPQPPRLPAAAVPGGDGLAVAGGHQLADPHDPARPEQLPGRCWPRSPASIVAPAAADRQAASVDYDYLILAAGATHAYFGHDEWAPIAPGLKSIEDATELRRRILLAFESAEYEGDEEAPPRGADVRDRRRGRRPASSSPARSRRSPGRRSRRTTSTSTRGRRASSSSKAATACCRRSRRHRARAPSATSSAWASRCG